MLIYYFFLIKFKKKKKKDWSLNLHVPLETWCSVVFSAQQQSDALEDFDQVDRLDHYNRPIRNHNKRLNRILTLLLVADCLVRLSWTEQPL